MKQKLSNKVPEAFLFFFLDAFPDTQPTSHSRWNSWNMEKNTERYSSTGYYCAAKFTPQIKFSVICFRLTFYYSFTCWLSSAFNQSINQNVHLNSTSSTRSQRHICKTMSSDEIKNAWI